MLARTNAIVIRILGQMRVDATLGVVCGARPVLKEIRGAFIQMMVEPVRLALKLV